MRTFFATALIGLCAVAAFAAAMAAACFLYPQAVAHILGTIFGAVGLYAVGTLVCVCCGAFSSENKKQLQNDGC